MQALQDPACRRLLLRQVGSVTPENGLKWEVFQPRRGHFDFRQGDALLRLARRHGLEMRGHTLVWDRQEPAWLDAVPARELGPVLHTHILTLMGRYRGQLRSWDVINEPLAEDGSGLRRHRWWRALGPDYIALALNWAHRSDPGARLVINEYGLEGETPSAAARRRALLDLLHDLRRRQVPLHAIGLQAHLRAEPGSGHFDGLGPFLEQLQALGLEIEITELDVDDRRLPADPGLRDRLVADLYGRFLAVVLRNGAVRRVTSWGLSDRYSWLNDQAPAPTAGGSGAFPSTPRCRPSPPWRSCGNEESHRETQRASLAKAAGCWPGSPQ